jgi:intracellular septation protein
MLHYVPAATLIRFRYHWRPSSTVSGMQLLFDFLPVIAFFVAYKLADIYVATMVIIIATILQVSIYWLRTRRVKPMHLVTAGLVLVFGGLTLAIHDPVFIMWKPTVVDWLFAVAFLASQWRLFGSQPLVQRMITATDATLTLTPAAWRRLNMAWVVFFLMMGAINVFVFRNFDESTWVNFKMFGMLGLTFVFIIAQGLWIASRTSSS